MKIYICKNKQDVAVVYLDKNKYILKHDDNEFSYFEVLRSESHISLSNEDEILRINRYTGQIDKLTSDGFYVSKFPDCVFTICNSDKDNNNEIIGLIHERLQLGRCRYGHGVNIDHDTREFGTTDNSWETMMMEEALDGMIYAAAAILRIKQRR